MALLKPMPDEALLSVIQRLVVLDRATNERKAAKRLFNSSSLQFGSTFPSVIPTLASELNYPAEYWVEHHSVLPHYRSFTPKRHFERAISNLVGGKGEAVFKDLSLIANRQCTGLTMNFCPQCAIEDNEAFGVPYWHVVHQLSGAFVCLTHKISLVSQTIYRKRFDNWPCYGFSNSRLASDIELKLVRFVRYFQYHQPEAFHHTLCEIYRARLDEMGFITPCGNVRVKLLRASMLAVVGPILRQAQVQAIFENTRFPLYPACVLTHRDAAISPLKHLLVIAFLFESVTDLINHVTRYSPKDREVNKVPAKQVKDDTADIITLLENGYSLRCVAAKTEHSVTYVKKVAKTAGIAIETRTQKLFKTERRKITMKLLAGHPTDVIAKAFDCSQGAIEQILSQNPDIVALRKLRRKLRKMTSMRKSLIKTISSLTAPHRQDVRRENNAAYMWLFKHDKVWLYAHLPAAIPRKHRRAKTEGQTLSSVFFAVKK